MYFAIKKDVFSYSSICIYCVFTNNSEFIIDEETPGWNRFRMAIREHCTIDDKWISQITQPAFKGHEIILFSKGLPAAD